MLTVTSTEPLSLLATNFETGGLAVSCSLAIALVSYYCTKFGRG